MFGKKKRNEELITKNNIEEFLKKIDESIITIAKQSPEGIRDSLLKESQMWIDNTVNKNQPLDVDSFKAGACYGLFRYFKITIPDKPKKMPSYVA